MTIKTFETIQSTFLTNTVSYVLFSEKQKQFAPGVIKLRAYRLPVKLVMNTSNWFV